MNCEFPRAKAPTPPAAGQAANLPPTAHAFAEQALVDECHIASGWRRYRYPHVLSWLIGHTSRLLGVDAVHVVGYGDYRVEELARYFPPAVSAATSGSRSSDAATGHGPRPGAFSSDV